MRLLRNHLKMFVGVIVLGFLYCGIAMPFTSHPSKRPCPAKPYNVRMDVASFTPEQQQALRDMLDDLNYKGFDEVYLRFCNYIADESDCNMMKTDTIQACNWPDTCDTGDLFFSDDYTGETPTVTINTAVLQLLAKPIDRDHTIDPCATTANEKYLETPVFRFRGTGGDSLDLTFEGTLDSTESPHHQAYFLPDNAYSGAVIWRFDPASHDTTGTNRQVYRGEQWPCPTLTQSGVVKNVNTSMTRDTIVFATAFSNSHGGSHSGSAEGFLQPTWGTSLNRNYCSGYRYTSLGGEYSVNVRWIDDPTYAYSGDSLWVVSRNDSSFVLGIQWSTSTRVLNWTTSGKWKDDY